MVTHNDPADVDYAGGLAAHVVGVPKTSFDGSVTAIETETGALNNFAQAVSDAGGHLPECKILFGLSDGSMDEAVKIYTIHDVAITFSDGGGEIDASSRSQILTVSGQMRYMYFGENAELGVKGGMNALTTQLVSGKNNLFNNIMGAIGSQFNARNPHLGI